MRTGIARIILVVVALSLVLGLAPPIGVARAADDIEQPTAATTAPKHPRLAGELAAARSPLSPAAVPEPIRIVVELAAGADPGAVRAGIVALGGAVEGEYADLVKASVAPGALDGVAALPGVRWVRPPAAPRSEAVAGQGVTATNAGAWQVAGQQGAGVKVAIIDSGFAGYAARQASGDLPATLTTKDQCGGQFNTATPHGAAVAEIVHEMAPAAQLYLICIADEVDLGLAVDYAIAQGVAIISHSIGWFNTSRGDGSGGAATPEGIAAKARAAGILWVNSAGNYAETHWSGTFADADVDKLHEFSAGDEGLLFRAASGQRFCAYLKWDSWPTTDQDYDLFIYRKSDNIVVASSQNTQSGTQPPTEAGCYTNTGAAQDYYAAIQRYSGTATPRLDLYINGVANFEYPVAAGSLNDIASSPASFAAAAICWQGDGLEDYSSRGPTIDGRIKPDIAGQDSVSSATYGTFAACGSSGFTGTSAAAPHVAGAAAIAKGAQPGLTVAQLQSFLEGRAIDLGPAGKDASYGVGKLWLGSTSSSVYTLTIAAASGGAAVAAPAGPFFAPGATTTLTTTPVQGFAHTGWIVDGAAKGWAASLSLTMDADHTVQPVFRAVASFPDVTSGRADYAAIVALASRGTILGYANGTYGPDNGVQRAQMAALIARAMPGGPGTPTGGTLTPPGCVIAGSWDCEVWANPFQDQNGLDANLWRNVGALAGHNVAKGYAGADCTAKNLPAPCFAPTAPVSYIETVVFITRAMIAKGYWVSQPTAAHPYAGFPAVFAPEVATFHFYTAGAGGVPAPPGNWNAGATRGWFARALWQALNAYWGTDGPLPDGRPAGGYVP